MRASLYSCFIPYSFVNFVNFCSKVVVFCNCIFGFGGPRRLDATILARQDLNVGLCATGVRLRTLVLLVFTGNLSRRHWRYKSSASGTHIFSGDVALQDHLAGASPSRRHFIPGRTVAKRASGMLEDSELPRIRQPSECKTRCMRVRIFSRVAVFM